MCCLFGIYNYSGKNIKTLPKLTNALAREATIRGLDATGIAYNNKGHLLIHKEAKSAYSITFNHPEDATAIMGHIRHTTQGNEKNNYNTHPFPGRCYVHRSEIFRVCHKVNSITAEKFDYIIYYSVSRGKEAYNHTADSNR